VYCRSENENVLHNIKTGSVIFNKLKYKKIKKNYGGAEEPL